MVGLWQYKWGRTIRSMSYLPGHRTHTERQVSVFLLIFFIIWLQIKFLGQFWLLNTPIFCLILTLDFFRSGESTRGSHSLQRPKAKASPHVSITMTSSLQFCQFLFSVVNNIMLIFSNVFTTLFIVPQETVCVYISGGLPPDLLADPVFPLSTEYGYVTCGTTVIYGLFHSRNS